MTRRLVFLFMAMTATVVSLGAPRAYAADPIAGGPGWKVTVAPYGWATWLEGDQTVWPHRRA